MDNCTKTIFEFYQHPQNFTNYISYSGKGINELGDYNNCLKDQSSSYFLVSMYSALLPPELSTFIGVCFSQYCSPEQVQAVLPMVASSMNLTDMSGVDYYVRKSNGDEGSVTVDHSTYIIVVVLFLILVLGFIHPLMNLLKKKSPPKRNDEGKLDLENLSVATKDATITAQLLPNDGDKRKKPSRLEDFFKCFAVDQNLKRLISIREGPLDFFNGVRALSLLYVIFGHDYYLRAGMSQNPAYLLDFIRTPYFLIIGTAFYAVDVFFWLSGFFLAFVLLDPATKK